MLLTRAKSREIILFILKSSLLLYKPTLKRTPTRAAAEGRAGCAVRSSWILPERVLSSLSVLGSWSEGMGVRLSGDTINKSLGVGRVCRLPPLKLGL